MSGYDDPYAWERREAYLAAIHGAKGDTPGISRVPRSERKACVDCGAVYYSWGAHAERCRGPRETIQDLARRIAAGGTCGQYEGQRLAREYIALTGMMREDGIPRP